jgi:hypothetical protein
MLIVKDELTPYSIRGSATFEVEITNIPKEQSRAVNLAQVKEAPQKKTKIEHPSSIKGSFR